MTPDERKRLVGATLLVASLAVLVNIALAARDLHQMGAAVWLP